MKVKSLAHYPQQLGDERMIGAAGTVAASEREYDLPELTREDKRRVKRGLLEVVQEEEKPADKTEKPVEPVAAKTTVAPASVVDNSKTDSLKGVTK
jgi:hypothetical protein